jgi:hypothetical protein
MGLLGHSHKAVLLVKHMTTQRDLQIIRRVLSEALPVIFAEFPAVR